VHVEDDQRVREGLEPLEARGELGEELDHGLDDAPASILGRVSLAADEPDRLEPDFGHRAGSRPIGHAHAFFIGRR